MPILVLAVFKKSYSEGNLYWSQHQIHTNLDTNAKDFSCLNYVKPRFYIPTFFCSKSTAFLMHNEFKNYKMF